MTQTLRTIALSGRAEGFKRSADALVRHGFVVSTEKGLELTSKGRLALMQGQRTMRTVFATADATLKKGLTVKYQTPSTIQIVTLSGNTITARAR